MKRLRHRRNVEAELDITAFMNLMIVLVPILLLGMVFSRITVVDVVLPQSASSNDATLDEQQLEIIIRGDSLRLDYPRGVLLKNIPLTSAGDHDYALLSLVLQEVNTEHLYIKTDLQVIKGRFLEPIYYSFSVFLITT